MYAAHRLISAVSCGAGLRPIVFALLALIASITPQHAGADARFCISDQTLIFGNRQVGGSTSANVTVSNCGDQPWMFTDVSVHPATGAAFHVDTACATGMSLATGASCDATVVFAPLATGQTSGGLWLRNTTADSDPLLTFYGRGVDARAGTATLAFVPEFAAFGAQAVGTQSAPLTIGLQNQGAASLTLSAIVLNGPQVYDFGGFDDECQVGSSIPPGQSCHMSLYFRPQAAGSRLANLVIDSPQLASLAILQVSGTGTLSAAATAIVIEFYYAALDHYFMSSLAPDIDALDSGHFPGWVRTGRSFGAYALPTPGANPVCRFYLPPPQDSHFYSASPDECAAVANRFPTFVLEAPDVFYIPLPDTTTGACPAGTIPVYRLYNNRPDANHRYTTDPAIKAQMLAKGYIAEGYGPDAVIMCAPQ